MDWVRSTSWGAVIGKRLTTCARHSSKDLAALQQVILSLVDLCGMSVSMRPNSRLLSKGYIAAIHEQARGQGPH
jgi:hypothetical protein